MRLLGCAATRRSFSGQRRLEREGATGTPPPRKAPRTNPPPPPPRTAAPLLGAMDPTPRGTTTDLQQDLKDVSHLQMIRLSQVNINIACKEMHKKSSYR